MEHAGPLPLACRRYQNGAFQELSDLVSPEVPVFVRFPGRPDTRLWAYPVDLAGLALGHARIEWCAPGEEPVLTGREDSLYILGVRPAAPAGAADWPAPMAAPSVLATMQSFISACGLWDGTGCFHRAAAYDPASGAFLARAEDIGRHNCLDRLAGWALGAGQELGRLALFVSARITASLMDKARRAGFRVLVSRSAVTTASVDAAREHGLTLIGFARSEEARFTVFNDERGWVRP
jgi:FdhD protein